MNKVEFAHELRRALGKLPSYEVEQSVSFYSEAIDDRMEEGMTEEAAVADLGPIDVIAAQIIAEVPPIPKAIAKANTGSRTLNIVLLVLLSPLWVPVVAALAAAIVMVYAAIWMVIIALWMMVAFLLLCAPLGIAMLVWCIGMGYPLTGVFQLGIGIAASGVGLFAWFGVLAASKALVGVTRMFGRWVKSRFVRADADKGEDKGANQEVEGYVAC